MVCNTKSFLVKLYYFILFLLWVAFIAQVIDALQKYFAGRTSISISNEIKDSLDLPAITVCSSNAFKVI